MGLPPKTNESLEDLNVEQVIETQETPELLKCEGCNCQRDEQPEIINEEPSVDTKGQPEDIKED